MPFCYKLLVNYPPNEDRESPFSPDFLVYHYELDALNLPSLGRFFVYPATLASYNLFQTTVETFQIHWTYKNLHTAVYELWECESSDLMTYDEPIWVHLTDPDTVMSRVRRFWNMVDNNMHIPSKWRIPGSVLTAADLRLIRMLRSVTIQPSDPLDNPIIQDWVGIGEKARNRIPKV